jgi:hypothetical protein
MTAPGVEWPGTSDGRAREAGSRLSLWRIAWFSMSLTKRRSNFTMEFDAGDGPEIHE